jgi:O-antigen/teichoic acid export membrane protein
MRLVRAGSLAHSSGLLGLAAIAGRVANVGLLVVLARNVGQQAVAFYGLATLAASFIALTASLGLSTYVTRAVALGEIDNKAVRAIHTARGAVLTMSVGVLGIVSAAFVPSRFAIGYVLFAIASVADSWNDTSWSAIRGTPKAGREAATNASTYVLGLCVVLFVWRIRGISFTEASVVWASSGIVRSLLACALTRVWPTAGFAEVVATLRAHIRRALPYLGSDVLGLAYLRGDTFVLSFFVSTTALGSYVAAASFSSPLVQISSAMALGALAKLGRGAKQGDLEKVVDFFGFAGSGISVAISAALPAAVVILYGSSRGQVLILSLVLTAFVPLRFCNSAVSSVVLLHGGAAYRLFIVLFSVLLNVGLNVALDGQMGARGAALATVLTEAFVTIGFVDVLRRQRVQMRRRGVLVIVALVDSAYATALSGVFPLREHLGFASAIFVGIHLTIAAIFLRGLSDGRLRRGASRAHAHAPRRASEGLSRANIATSAASSYVGER